VLAEGAQVPEATVFDPELRPVGLSSLAGDGPYLLAFYLYDWTGT
jgi:peroxiredoxin